MNTSSAHQLRKRFFLIQCWYLNYYAIWKNLLEKPFLYCCLRKLMLKEIQFTLIVTFLINQQQAQQQLISINPHIIFLCCCCLYGLLDVKRRRGKIHSWLQWTEKEKEYALVSHPLLLFLHSNKGQN